MHHSIPLIGTKAYVDWIQLGYHRLPGFGKVKRGDAVVFNYPDGDTVSTAYQSNVSYYSLVRQFGWEAVNSDKNHFGDIIARPVDKRENFIKRCVGLPGETLKIENGAVYINAQRIEDPENLQLTHRIITTNNNALNEKELLNIGVSKEDMATMYAYCYIDLNTQQIKAINDNPYGIEATPLHKEGYKYSAITDNTTKLHCKVFFHPDLQMYDKNEFFLKMGIDSASVAKAATYATLPLSKEIIEKLKDLPYVEKIELVTTMQGFADNNLFPYKADYDWNVDFYGPVRIPQKGMTITLNEDNLAFYERAITVLLHQWQTCEGVHLQDGLLLDARRQSPQLCRQPLLGLRTRRPHSRKSIFRVVVCKQRQKRIEQNKMEQTIPFCRIIINQHNKLNL